MRTGSQVRVDVACGALTITLQTGEFLARTSLTRDPTPSIRNPILEKPESGPALGCLDSLTIFFCGFGWYGIRLTLSCPKPQIGASPRAERAKQRCRARHVPSDKPIRVRLGRSIAGVTGAVPRDARIDRGSGHRERRDGFRLRLQVERRMLRDAATHGAPRARRARRRAGAARGAEIPRHAEGASPFRSPDTRRPRSRHGDARDTTP